MQDGSGAPERLIQPAVQQRLHMLSNSRQVLGTARGMLLLHSRGSQSSAVAFHKAVKEARLKLQQQAAALKAAGQLQHLQQAGPGAAAVDSTGPAPAAAVAPAGAAAALVASAAALDELRAEHTGQEQLAGPPAATQPSAAVGPPSSGCTSGAADCAAAAAAALKPASRKSATVGQLARASLTQKTLLFDGKRPPPLTTPAITGAGTAAANSASCPVAAAAAAGSSIRAAQVTASAAAAAERGRPVATAVSPEPALVCEALERGMSVPNPEVGLLPRDGYYPIYGAHRCAGYVTLLNGPTWLKLYKCCESKHNTATVSSAGTRDCVSVGSRINSCNANVACSFMHM